MSASRARSADRIRDVRSVPGPDRRVTVLATIAAAGAGAYVAILVALPLLDWNVNMLNAHPEDYARGQLGLAVNLSYLALAVALASFALSALPFKGWAMALLLLVAPPAILCAALAVDPVGVATTSPLLLLPIVCLALVPLIGSVALRDRLAAWRPSLAGFAILVLIAFAGLVVAPEAIGGAVNRLFDVTVGLWLGLASIAVRRGSVRLPTKIGAGRGQR